jgi:L,D-peptidoglycan transpeptidase YkuD (ErfK/YbiS/YcfS/YnhG family)
MLHVLLATALSVTPVLPADSVRPATRPGTARPDTTLLTLPTPAISAPPAKAPVVVAPAAPATNILQRVREIPVPGARPAAPRSDVVQQSSSARSVAAAPAPVAGAVAVATTKSTSAVSRLPVPTPVAAAADASAVAAPSGAVSTTRIDARTVVSVKSSVITAPKYAVPIPAIVVRIPAPTIADSIVVYKRERTLTLFYRGVPVRSYFVALGSKPVGDKIQAGDRRTPEGLFRINAHNPASKYHLALRISYPDDAHRARAAALGVDPGGDIMIHGLSPEYSAAGKQHLQNDWTNGCVALSNQEIEEIWRAVPDGTPVQIKP